MMDRNPPPMLACPLTPIHAPMPQKTLMLRVAAPREPVMCAGCGATLADAGWIVFFMISSGYQPAAANVATQPLEDRF